MEDDTDKVQTMTETAKIHTSVKTTKASQELGTQTRPSHEDSIKKKSCEAGHEDGNREEEQQLGYISMTIMIAERKQTVVRRCVPTP